MTRRGGESKVTPRADGARITALVRWFEQNARDLPWRRDRNGYAALVSEAMLQQTQVSRVIERYQRFMAQFPTVYDLAAADERKVLTLWQGLGYYRRARNVHAAAKRIVAEHDGRVPRDVDELMRLPGVGRYTAGAIASIIFDQRAPIVDGNVERVLARWYAHRDTADDRDGLRRWAWRTAERLVAQTDAPGAPGALNEALMELGATVCTPRKAKCETCPVAKWCAAHRQGLQNEIPEPKRAPAQSIVHHHAVIVRRGRRILFEQRPENGLWSSMWQTPTIESSRPLRPAEIACRLSTSVSAMQRCGRFEHQTTHRRITFHVFTATSRVRTGTWRKPDDVADLPLSSPQQRIVAMAAATTAAR
jgi:A/G-specific adenine glycosylase